MKARAPVIAASLLLLGVLCTFNPARAQSPAGGMVPLNLTVRGTTTVGLGDDGGDPIDKFTSKTSSWTANDLLKLIAFSSGYDYKGCKLQYDPSYRSVLVVDRVGNFIEDLTGDGYISISLDPDGSGAWSGQINNNTGATKFTGSYLATLSFDDQIGDSSESVGLMKETYSITAMDVNGCQKGSDTWSITLAGDGGYQGNPSNGTMTITGSGRGTFCNGMLVAVEPSDAANESAP